MLEIWKGIPGYEGLYEVSNTGRVRSLPRNGTSRFIKILKLKLFEGRYFDAGLSKNNKRKDIRVHRLVALAFVPNPENKPFVNHIDGNKQNNRVENLEWCTHKENMDHAVKNSLCAQGERNYWSILKESDIIDICLFRKKGLTHKEIAQKYKVDKSTIGLILSNKNWKHVERP